MTIPRTPLYALFALVTVGAIGWSLSHYPERDPGPIGSGRDATAVDLDQATVLVSDRDAAGPGSPEEEKEEGHAWEMFEWWYGQRAYPNELIPKRAYFDAWQYAQQVLPRDESLRGGAAWQSIGPDNIGGRMLALAFDPNDSSVLWAGSASGGLWVSTTGGVGASAWSRVETSLPALSVSAIVIDPGNADRMWIGTGEISLYQRPLVGTPGARASYGIGVLASTDGGVTWHTTGLDWSMDQQRAVLAMKMSPTDSNVLYAATSEGVYKTTDAGTTWTNVHPVLMAMDVVVHPDGNTVYASHGQLGTPEAPDAGIYKSTNGGSTWTQLGGGLPTTDFGRTPLSMSSDGSTVFAGVSNATTREVTGLYRTTNGGSTWQLRDGSENWASGQAWYDNTIAVSPFDANRILCAGLEVYRSTSGGTNLTVVTNWAAGYEGVIPAGGPEGPDDYVHADQHAILWDPNNANVVYVACDGGIFRSTDAGSTWGGVNGGLRTTQFYNGFANGLAYTSTFLGLGGLQDNGTVLYSGSDSWSKVFGGDGGWCAIDPTNEDVLYEEYVYLNMFKSTDGGSSWNEVHGYSSGSANFIAPFVLCPSAPNTLYAGQLAIEKSTNGGASWSYGGGGSNWNDTPMASIGVSNLDANYVIGGTGNSSTSATMEVRRSTNGGANWTVATGLPDRYPTDFIYDPNDKTVVWATFSGYGTGHVFRSTDAGTTWSDVSGNLPDIPHQSIAVDPMNGDWAYVGTDLGVFRTQDGGATWSDFNSGIPIAMILDLVLHLDSRTLRAATFGNGVYEIVLPETSSSVDVVDGSATWLEASPNPFRAATTVQLSLAKTSSVDVAVYDATGRRIRSLVQGERPAGVVDATWDGLDANGVRVAAGVYFVRAVGPELSESRKITYLR